MKNWGSWTIRTAVFGTLFLVTLAVWGQGGNPPANTEESRATSGHGMTPIEQTYKGSVEQQIKTLHEEGRQAALKGDAGFFEKYLARDYCGIGGDGRLRSKAETIADLKSGAIKFVSIDERDVKVNTYGNSAVVISEASVTLTMQGKPISGDYRATFVYVKQGGAWREVAHQVTPVMKQGQ